MPKTKRELKNILDENQIRLRKKWGQNLLIDKNIIRLIIDSIALKGPEIIFELGAGTGQLTESLAQFGNIIYAIELDKKLMEIGQSISPSHPNIHWINEDILKFDFQSIINQYNERPVYILGNLPYYITTPIIMRFLEDKIRFDRMIIMIQKEVAERILAVPDSKEYGILSLMIQYRVQVDKIRIIPHQSFYPIPEVDSILLEFRPYSRPPVDITDEKIFIRLIRTVFQKRRKMIINTLDRFATEFTIPKIQLIQALDDSNISPKSRPEQLSLQDYARLTNRFAEYKRKVI